MSTFLAGLFTARLPWLPPAACTYNELFSIYFKRDERLRVYNKVDIILTIALIFIFFRFEPHRGT